MVLASPLQAQQVYRCVSSVGVSEYINNAKEATTRSCKTMTGGNVTVVPGTAVASPGGERTPARLPTPGTPVARPDGGSEQRVRDSDSRAILEAELRKSETRLAELQKEYNDGEPEKQGTEARNYQRYLDRVAELKGSIGRSQSDVAGIKRELARLPSVN